MDQYAHLPASKLASLPNVIVCRIPNIIFAGQSKCLSSLFTTASAQESKVFLGLCKAAPSGSQRAYLLPSRLPHSSYGSTHPQHVSITDKSSGPDLLLHSHLRSLGRRVNARYVHRRGILHARAGRHQRLHRRSPAAVPSPASPAAEVQQASKK